MQLNEVIRGQLQRAGARCLSEAREPAASDNYFMALCATRRMRSRMLALCLPLYMAGIAIFGNPFVACGQESGSHSSPSSSVIYAA